MSYFALGNRLAVTDSFLRDRRAVQVKRRQMDNTFPIPEGKSNNNAEVFTHDEMPQGFPGRARLNAAIIELGRRALSADDLQTLLDEAVTLVAQILKLEYSMILELLPDNRTLLLRAGVGWIAGSVGRAIVESGPNSQAGRVLLADEPVIVEDAQLETRFPTPSLLREHGIICGMSVIIPGRHRPFGVLGVHSSKRRIFTADEVHFIQSLASIVAQSAAHKKMEIALHDSENRYREMASSLPEVVFETDEKGRLTFANRIAYKSYGYTQQDLAEGLNILQLVAAKDQQRAEKDLQRVLAGAEFVSAEYSTLSKDGRTSESLVHALPIIRDQKVRGIRGVVADITEHKRLEERFYQSQKMEAIGRLAGGVAHDFNNLVTVIMGCSELILGRLAGESTIRADIERIMEASQRAAALTGQLLAFGRKQILSPRVLDLNDIVTSLEKMLRRLIGEDIRIIMKLEPHLGMVKADPGQLEQVIMNLAVNARDAMPEGGKLIIESSNVELDEDCAHEHVPVTPGPYVRLAISDSGCGMTPEIQAHLFEPFFTTKEMGKGTGLGLSTAYGIVKQSGGYIWVYSEVGKGTTFKIDLPRVEELIAPASAIPSEGRTFAGTETLLLVEDDDAVRELAGRVLEQQGYTLIYAQDALEAEARSEEHHGLIHLLLTDVVMPGVGGRRLAQRLTQRHPKMKVLYMSGYTDNPSLQHGMLDSRILFLQKPFTPEDLIRKVREVLET
jgi:two-component system cell cycle sensor histidine kinase/response regulator CckA